MNISSAYKGILLETLTWLEAERVLDERAIVVIPIGAVAKEHGPHLKLNNDWTLAEYLKRRVLQRADVIVAPTVGFHFYPAFADYPGSISLRLETARDLMVDICRSLAHFGPRRFYALNTGVSTVHALQAAAEVLGAEGILLHYTDLLRLMGPIKRDITTQEGGTHADEAETSMMLYIKPSSVDMRKAVKDYHPGVGNLTRDPQGVGAYSASGVYGDATLATRAKGQRLIAALVAEIIRDLVQLRAASVFGPSTGA